MKLFSETFWFHSLISGSFGGGRTLSISGSGFGDEMTTMVTVCGNECPILNIGPNAIECDVPGSESKL